MDDRLLDERHAAVMDAFDKIQERLDIQNGRLRSAEIEVAILKDRNPTRTIASVGAGAGAVGAGIAEIIRMMLP